MYPVPSSSTITAGSKSHTISAQAGSFREISGFLIGSLKGPVGLSEQTTPIPFPESAKYKKNLSLPFIFLHAIAGAQEFVAHDAGPFYPATGIVPQSVQFTKSLEE